eukprot:gene18580-22374_t
MTKTHKGKETVAHHRGGAADPDRLFAADNESVKSDRDDVAVGGANEDVAVGVNPDVDEGENVNAGRCGFGGGGGGDRWVGGGTAAGAAAAA